MRRFLVWVVSIVTPAYPGGGRERKELGCLGRDSSDSPKKKRVHPRTRGCAVNRGTTGPIGREDWVLPKLLPRKEVIQLHVPVPLPCYDFAPLMKDTLGALIGRLQVPPTRLA